MAGRFIIALMVASLAFAGCEAEDISDNTDESLESSEDAAAEVEPEDEENDTDEVKAEKPNKKKKHLKKGKKSKKKKRNKKSKKRKRKKKVKSLRDKLGNDTLKKLEGRNKGKAGTRKQAVEESPEEDEETNDSRNSKSARNLIGEDIYSKSAPAATELDPAQVAQIIRSRQRAIQGCYEKELKRDSSLAGKIEVRFTIGSNGQVKSAAVIHNSMGSPSVGSCIVKRIRSWRFPESAGDDLTVAFPFIFTPSAY